MEWNGGMEQWNGIVERPRPLKTRRYARAHAFYWFILLPVWNGARLFQCRWIRHRVCFNIRLVVATSQRLAPAAAARRKHSSLVPRANRPGRCGLRTSILSIYYAYAMQSSTCITLYTCTVIPRLSLLRDLQLNCFAGKYGNFR